MSKSKFGRALLAYSQCLRSLVQQELEFNGGATTSTPKTYVIGQILTHSPTLRKFETIVSGHLEEMMLGDAPEKVVSEEFLQGLTEAMELKTPLNHTSFGYLILENVNKSFFPGLEVIAKMMVGEEEAEAYDFALEIVNKPEVGMIDAFEDTTKAFIEGVTENWFRTSIIKTASKSGKK